MRLNEKTSLIGKNVVLVPYRIQDRHEHVQPYHEWMKSPELLEATASEPLSLEEEYEMQQKWHLDEDKLTFIVLDRQSRQMIGDTNLFLPDGPQEDVECEIMIAELAFRGKGLSTEILSLMLNYAQKHLSIPTTNFIARIGLTNAGSIALFHKLGFGKEKVVEVFQEVTMRMGWVEGVEDGKMGEGERVEGLRKERWVDVGEEVEID